MVWTPKSLKLFYGSQEKKFGEFSGGVVETASLFILKQ